MPQVLCLAGEARNVSHESLSSSLSCREAWEDCIPLKRRQDFLRPYYMFNRLNPCLKNNRTLLECMDKSSKNDYYSRTDRYRAIVVHDFPIPAPNLPLVSEDLPIPALNWPVGFFEYIVHLINFSWPIDVIEGIMPFSVYGTYLWLFRANLTKATCNAYSLESVTQEGIDKLTRSFSRRIVKDFPNLSSAEILERTNCFETMLTFTLDYAAIVHGLIFKNPAGAWICNWFPEEESLPGASYACNCYLSRIDNVGNM
jgi:hypothetical protein